MLVLCTGNACVWGMHTHCTSCVPCAGIAQFINDIGPGAEGVVSVLCLAWCVLHLPFLYFSVSSSVV
jgi:hypothetical protein